MSETNESLGCHIYDICPNYLMCINGESMPMYMPYTNSLVSTTWPEVLHIDAAANDHANTNDNANSEDEAASLH